ncbi:MAG: FAD-binding monooxygenase, partial [Mycobacterium sp.]
DKCQDIPNRVDHYAPNSPSDIAINIAVMKWMQRWPFRAIASRIWFTTADSIDLPDYQTP